MTAWAEIDRRTRERNAPLFAKAEALSARLGAAIALGTCHKARLRTLRAGLRNEIACCNPLHLRMWLADFEAAIDAECRAAHATVSTAYETLSGLQREPEKRAGIFSRRIAA